MSERQLRIRSLADVAEILDGGEIREIVSLLDAVSQNPDALLAYPKHVGKDIIDLLLEMTQRPQGPGLWLHATLALTAFRDPRVATYMLHGFVLADDPSIMRLMAERLSHEPLEPMREILSRLVRQDQSIHRARLAARLLLGAGPLAPAEELRVALLAEVGDRQAPALDEVTLPLWLDELNGTLIMEARQELERQGEPALTLLMAHWGELSEENQEWVLRRASVSGMTGLDGLLAAALSSESQPLALAAMTLLAGREPAGERFRPALEPWRRHPDPAVRLAALAAEPESADWRALLSAESDARIRCECLVRIGSREGGAAVPLLLPFLESDAWELRSAAISGLIETGEAAREPARGLISHPVEEVRVAAAQVLLGLEDDAWLEANVIGRTRGGE